MHAHPRELLRVFVPVRTGNPRHAIADGRSDSDLNALQCIENVEAELPIEDVEVEYVVETGIAAERVAPVTLEASNVCGQSVVAEVPQVPGSALFIRDD